MAKALLNKYKDVFSVSNDIVGTALKSTFDLDTSNMSPVAVPLRRIPVRHRIIVEQLLERYTKLGLIEPFDSPFRAPCKKEEHF